MKLLNKNSFKFYSFFNAPLFRLLNYVLSESIPPALQVLEIFKLFVCSQLLLYCFVPKNLAKPVEASMFIAKFIIESLAPLEFLDFFPGIFGPKTLSSSTVFSHWLSIFSSAVVVLLSYSIFEACSQILLCFISLTFLLGHLIFRAALAHAWPQITLLTGFTNTVTSCAIDIS